MTAMNKRELRAWLRSRHEGADVRAEQSAAICRHILESSEYKSACVIGGYMPLPREADIVPVLRNALQQGKTVALPLCGKAPQMTMRRIQSLDGLHAGAFDIPEPHEDAEIIPVQGIDLLLVPLEGIDKDGFRLGKGGGYYDCLLKEPGALTIGCALSWQWVEQLPRDPWDRRLHACADEQGLHVFNQ